MAHRNRIFQSSIRIIGRLLVLIALLAIFQEAVRLRLTSLVKAELQDPLPDGYTLDFKQTQLDWRNQTLQIQQLSLETDTTIATSSPIIELFLPLIRLDLQSIFLSIKSRRLFIENILIESPRVKLENKKGIATNFTQSSLLALDSLSYYLSLLKIQELKVNGAQLEHIQWQDSVAQSLKFKEINLFMSDFSIDASLRRHSFLNADQVELEIVGQSMVLPQNDHRLAFDTLWLSTKEKQILFTGLSIEPLSQVKPEKDLLHVTSPSLLLENVDFESAYLSQVLAIGQLKVQAPSVQLTRNKNNKSSPVGLEALREAIGRLAKRLQIELIAIKEADFDLNLTESEFAAVQFDLDSILVKDFVTDNNTSFSDPDQLPFRDVQLYLSNIQQRLDPSIGPIHIQKARLNSSKKNIVVEGLKIGDPLLLKQNVYQYIPIVQLEGIDIFDVLLRKKAAVRQISCLRPFTRLNLEEDFGPHPKDQHLFQGLRSFFEDFFLDDISSEVLEIRNGQLQSKGKVEVQNYNYRGRGLQLNKKADSWTEITSDSDLQASSFCFRLKGQEELKGDSLWMSGEDAHVFQLAYNQKDSNRLIRLQTSFIALKGLQLDSLLAGRLFADSLLINDPHLQYQEKQSSSSQLKSGAINLPLIILNRGKLTFQNLQKENIHIHRFDGILAFQDSFELKFSRFENLDYHADQSSHRLFIQRGRQIDEDYSFELDSLSLEPVIANSPKPNRMYIPNLRFYHWDQQSWQRDSLLKFQKIIADRSRTSLLFPGTLLFQQKKKTELPIQLDTLLLFNAQLDVKDSEKQMAWEFPSITLALYDLQLPIRDNPSSSIGSLLLGLDKGLKMEHPDFSLQTAPLFYNSDLKRIQTDSILYQSHKTEGFLKARIHQLDLNGINPDEIIKEDKWNLNSLAIDAAKIHYQRPDSLASQPLFPKDWPGISIQHLNLMRINADLQLDPPLEIEGLRIAGTGIHMDTSWQKGDFSQAWESLSTSIKEVSFSPDPQQHYQIVTGLNYQSKVGQLRFIQPELRRNLSLSAFTQQLDFRRDYWQGSADAIVVHDFHPKQLFADSLYFRKIHLDHIVAHDFNDETIPLRAEYKPMLPDQIKDLSVPFLVDTLSFSGDITYRAIAPLTGDSSWISFNDLEGRIVHLTNISRYFNQNMQLEARAKLYEAAPLKVDMQFVMDNTPTNFELTGSLQDIELPILNPILRGQAALAVTKGESSKLLFNLAANDSVAVGELLFRYKKLRIQLLDKEDLSNRSSFLSFWTNRMIQSRNPNWLRRRKGIIFFRRDQHKAITHYWAHSLLSGIVSSIGVKNTRRRLRKADLDISSFSYETLLKEQLKRRDKDN